MNNNRITVLACIDGSRYSDAVVDYAAWVARTVTNPLKLLHNIEDSTDMERDLSGNLEPDGGKGLLEEITDSAEKRNKVLLEQGKQLLRAAEERARSQNTMEISLIQRHDSLSESLSAMEEEIRVLVMGIRGEGHENQEEQNQIGAQLENVIRSMHKPVLVVNCPFEAPPTQIMLAYDGSEASRKALHMVATSPLYKGMTCHLVHVSKDADARPALLDEAVQQLLAGGLKVLTEILHGDVDHALQQYQREHNIDMTVMGAFGHSWLRELLFGSVTVKMLCASRIPLLLLR